MTLALSVALLTARLLTNDSTSFVRINQLGYLPDAPKVAVVCSLDSTRVTTFSVEDQKGRVVLGPKRATASGSFGPCVTTHRLDFSALKQTGDYRIVAYANNGESARAIVGVSPRVRIGAHVYDGAADTLLYYMRQNRSGWNPLFKDSVHTHDGIIVDSPKAGRFIDVSGGWADASDYLQYVTTSANATFVMLMAYRDHRAAFADAFDAKGLPGSNGRKDVLDEAEHGLAWLGKMFPNDSDMYNQLGDDRDHAYFDLIVNDSSDYGWGKGKERPVYPCTGKPQGLLKYKNRADGYASTAGKYASAFAIAASIAREEGDTARANYLRGRALAAYALGRKYPGACQTAPGGAPYFYEEDNWADDMELGAAELYAFTKEKRFHDEALEYARREPVTPWMGADTARHYQWYPWHNNGHYELWRNATPTAKRTMIDNYRRGLDAVAKRANNGFRVGIPFIWCSSNLMASYATQAFLYRRMTGDTRFREYEAAALDWLFGANPWGTSMVIGLPNDGVWAHDPHSAVSAKLGPDKLLGGMLDGPVYRSIYQNLRGISLHNADEYAQFNTGFIVYHDDIGDYSTNEPIMDGTAGLTYLLSGMALEGQRSKVDGQRSKVGGRR